MLPLAGSWRPVRGPHPDRAALVDAGWPAGRAAALLEAIVARAVHDERLDADVRARTAGVRLQSYLLAVIVPALAAYLVATMPGLGATLATPLGRTVLVPLATALEVAGI